MTQTRSEYWRSLEDLADTAEFREHVANEFPALGESISDPLSRRRFLKVMGASMALAGLTGCTDEVHWSYSPFWPKEEILPFAENPEGRTGGVPVHYASAFELGGVAQPLLIKNLEGRPLKVEGNPDHPEVRGSSSSQAQASLLQFYDPDRVQKTLERAGNDAEPTGKAGVEGWAAFLQTARVWIEEQRSKQGSGFYVLAEPSTSLTQARQREAFKQAFPGATWLEWSPLARDEPELGAELAFGQRHRAHFDLSQARVIVSLDDDLLHMHPRANRHSRDFMDARRADGAAAQQTMNRLYLAEGVLTTTGTQADHRLALAPSRIPLLAVALAAKVMEKAGQAEQGVGKDLTALAGQLGEWHGLPTTGANEEQTKALARIDAWIENAAADLVEQRERGVLAAGPRMPAAVHALCHLVNEALGNAGNTVTYTAQGWRSDAPSYLAGIQKLAQDLDAGKVETLLILGGNPVLDAPAELGLKDKLTKVSGRRIIRLGLYDDETSVCSAWHLPQAHYLEAWDDCQAWDGTTCVVQPQIKPLYQGKTSSEVLALLLAVAGGGSEVAPTAGYELVRAAFRAGPLASQSEEGFEKAWRRALHDGFLKASPEAAFPPVKRAEVLAAVKTQLQSRPEAATKDAWELVVDLDPKLLDGRFANNGWLQELPDPLTKLTWDNALLVSPRTAQALGDSFSERDNNLVSVTAGEASLEVPVHVLPGMADHTAFLALGYGRKQGGVVADGAGVDAYPLRTSAAASAGLIAKVSVKPLGRHVPLSTTQDHHSIDTTIGRDQIQRRLGENAAPTEWSEAAWLVREASLEAYKKDGDFAQKVVGPDPETTQMWESPIDYTKADDTGARDAEGNKPLKYRWAMSIDLNACTGCSACVVACQAENNIPVVGKPEIARGREMHWLRIDRYFKGDYDDASGLEFVHQPVPCMQCENAPCESVCPVAATVHSQEGLNDMVYNRCIGTRYCANNCPYKVRRFNYFYNHYGPFHPRSTPRKGTVAEYTPPLPEFTARRNAIEKMALNPEVTQRYRGVMEKCTYCVQRIKEKTIPAENENRRVRDGEIVTACQQACPTQAIVFGDLNDENSRVHELHNHPRTYTMLAELNTRARTRFMAKLRNPRAQEGA